MVGEGDSGEAGECDGEKGGVEGPGRGKTWERVMWILVEVRVGECDCWPCLVEV